MVSIPFRLKRGNPACYSLPSRWPETWDTLPVYDETYFEQLAEVINEVDDVDYSAAETLRSIFAILKEKGIRLVVAQVLDDGRDQT